MSDPTQIGVRVWRIDHEGFPPIVQPESWTGSQENADSFARAVSKVGVSHTITEHVAIPLDAATLAKLVRDHVPKPWDEDCSDEEGEAYYKGVHAALRALGLRP